MESSLISRDLDLQHGDPETKRQEILKYFQQTWDIDEMVYTQLKSDDVFYHRGDPLRHVIIFYYGHTAAFYINKMMLAKMIDHRINPNYESIFAIGVDEMSWDDLNNKHYNWPSVDECRKYRKQVYDVVVNYIKTAPLTMPITWENPFWIILMGIEHARIHIETSSLLLRQLPINELVSGRFGKICTEYPAAPKNELLPVPGGVVNLGKSMDHPTYGWDNEYGTHTETIKDFKASKYLVSNEEYLEFVKAGGYHQQKYWTEEGWNWKEYKKAEMPLFWIKEGEDYKLRLVAEIIPMPWSWPVEINYLEAKAFTNWKAEVTGKKIRLPTEAEWMRLHEYCQVKDILEWKEAPGNLNFEHYMSTCPVNKFAFGEFYDIVGNAWQWTESPITGYSGFKVHPIYDDFTVPTYDGKHNLFKGGAWLSSGNEATKYARYAFRRHFYQVAGIRYIESDQDVVINTNEYATDPDVVLSCEASYGEKYDSNPLFPNFYISLKQLILDVTKGKDIKRVLDLNADTGRLAFELASHFEDITALDFTARFLRFAIQLQERGCARYVFKDEGELSFYRDVVLDEYGLKKRDNILFMQADAQNIKELYTGYDLVIIPNLLEELIYPRRVLSSIHERMNKGSTLIISSTYEFNNEITKREDLLGGFKKDGEPVTSLDGLKEVLGKHFELVQEPKDISFLVKKSSRVAEIRKSQVTVWKLK